MRELKVQKTSGSLSTQRIWLKPSPKCTYSSVDKAFANPGKVIQASVGTHWDRRWHRWRCIGARPRASRRTCSKWPAQRQPRTRTGSKRRPWPLWPRSGRTCWHVWPADRRGSSASASCVPRSAFAGPRYWTLSSLLLTRGWFPRGALLRVHVSPDQTVSRGEERQGIQGVLGKLNSDSSWPQLHGTLIKSPVLHVSALAFQSKTKCV